MSQDFEIGMLWVEGPLSYVEILCAKSFLDAGHHVKLFHYGPVSNVPDGVELVDGNSVLQIDKFVTHERTGSLALFSDVFRYHLLQQNDRLIWADLDAYCVRPFTSETGHFFGWESDHHINGGVLGLPPDSDALGQLLEMTTDEYGIPEWYEGKTRAQLEAAAEAGTPVHVSELPWGVWGPHAVTHYLMKTGEARYAFPVSGLYPIAFANRRHLLRAGRRESVIAALTPETFSIHFYGRRIKEKLVSKGGLPEPESYLDELLKKHDVDPAAAPVRNRDGSTATSGQTPGKTARTQAENPAAGKPSKGKRMNLTELADQFGSDKGSTKHRYTELYQMLFHPYRGRKISFLEMGLLIGGPEQGASAGRETRDVPSIRMWLDYFPKAMIHGLDISDFSWFEHDRFTFHRCDMDDRDQIRTAAAEITPSPTIVIDDASHASHHQQNAFLEIFPQVESGGLYVIEDLRWQPETYEHEGITKTAALFQSWIRNRNFEHVDPEVAKDFNALGPQISSCLVFPARFEKNRRDQLLVVQKR